MTVTCNDSTRTVIFTDHTELEPFLGHRACLFFKGAHAAYSNNVASTCKISSSGRGSTPAVCQVRHSTGRSSTCTCTSTCRDREESLSAIRIRNPHHLPGHGSLPFNFCCCPNSTSSIDLTASSACFTIIKKSSCPENWQGDHPSGLRLHYAYALTPKMESTTSPPSPTTRHFDLHTLPFSARTVPSPGGDHYSITRSEDFHCRHHRQK